MKQAFTCSTVFFLRLSCSHAYFGVYPFYGKLGAGFSTEVFLTGRTALFFKTGVEVLENGEFEVSLVPGTLPRTKERRHERRDQPAAGPEPYYVFTISYKY